MLLACAKVSPLDLLLEKPVCEEDLGIRQNRAAGSSLLKLFKSKWKTITTIMCAVGLDLNGQSDSYQ